MLVHASFSVVAKRHVHCDGQNLHRLASTSGEGITYSGRFGDCSLFYNILELF